MQALNPLSLPLNCRVLIEASAGTGKTFTIAALYLRLVLGHGRERPLLPQEILVVTFTEAATSELKGRIRARLSQAARYFAGDAAPVDPFLQALAAEFASSLWPVCAERLQLAAQAMDEACILTIHGWCNRMLTEHAFASGAAFGRELLTDEAALWQEVSQDYWRLHVYPMTTSQFERYSQTYASPDALQQDVMRLRDAVSGEVEAPVAAVQRELQERNQQLHALKAPWNAWIDELAALIEQGRAAGLTNNKMLQQNHVDNWWQKLRLWQQNDSADMPDIGKGAERLTPEGLAQAWIGPAPDHPALHAMAGLKAALAALPDASASLRQHAAAWCFAQQVQRKTNQRALGFDDLLTGLDTALAHSDAFVAVVRSQFPLALIDEFQDTDPLQYRIFSRVFGDNGPLILIGDPKQAIYGFRGADIYTYLQAKRESPLQFSLDTNYRSTQAVVDSVNHLFMHAEQRSSGLGAFMFREQQNLVAFQPVKAKGRDEQLRLVGQALPALRVHVFDDERPLSKSAWLQQAAMQTADSIAELLWQAQQQQCGFYQADTWLRPLQSRDIAVLVNNQREADAVRKCLLQHGIRSVYLSDKGNVFQSPMAGQLAIWLDAVLEPRLPKVRNALATMALGQSLAVLDSWQDHEWDWAQHQFIKYQQIWQRIGVQAMLCQLMFDYDVVATLAALPSSERWLTDLLQLSDLLQQASRTLDGERALLRYLHEHMQGAGELGQDATRLQLESDDALVRVVTIHKSKGLEYPCVFLPFMLLSREVELSHTPLLLHDAQGQVQRVFQPTEAQRQQADDERLAEDLRKLYVALTRACYFCQIEVAPLKERSALAYLLTPEAVLGAGHIAQLLAPWQQSRDIQLQAPTANTLQLNTTQELPDTGGYLTLAPRTRSRWWVASYSALLVEQTDVVGSKRAELLHELTEPSPVSALADVSASLQKGAAMGTFLHEQLEWASQQGFAKVAAQPQLWWGQLEKSAQHAGIVQKNEQGWRRHLLQSDEEQPALFDTLSQALEPLWLYLQQLLACQLPPLGMSLAQLPAALAELEFWLPVHKLPVRRLDQLIQQAVWPDEPRPALQEGQLHGMLKGFIDLLLFDGQHYYVMDFKSNSLAGYDDAHLQQAMLAKRYDVQAVLYCLALYRLLRSRGDANALHKIGPALYWFLRGSHTDNAGVLAMPCPAMLLLRLDQEFQEVADVDLHA